MDDRQIPPDSAGSLDGSDEESRAAERIFERLQALEPLCDRRMDVGGVENGSPLHQLDDLFSSSRSVSHLLTQSLVAAMDNLQALRRLLFIEAPDGNIYFRTQTHAPYALVRTIMECTATVLWALLPESSDERARRGLVLVSREVFNAAAFWDSYLREFHPERHEVAADYFDGLRRALNSSAEALRLPPMFRRKGDGSWGYATKNRTETAILKELRSSSSLPPGLIYAWQFCSGYSHGLEWTTAERSGYDVASSLAEDDAFQAEGMEQLRRMCDVAFDLIPQAWEVFDVRRRSGPFLNPGEPLLD
ncbi:hypothetical protein J2Y41_003429 [Arthrobacter sp. 1088]|uniref:hypothetical protein n=1 Tax=Arthrobacter sp. 1088 TaxID=2817768 RepID=UPI00285B023E|nr:hypothetical protein [Arthrobacter sp. 1088]MDR6687853.1 hypothetical protein [Arthrobacter sp. 1088]